MTETGLLSDAVIIATPAALAIALAGLALFAASVRVCVLGGLGAFALVVTSGDLAGLFGYPPGDSFADVHGSVAVAAAVAAFGCLFLATLLAVERAGRPRAVVRDDRVQAKSGATRASRSLFGRLRARLLRRDDGTDTTDQLHRAFELATRNSQITVFFQDSDLRYRWIVNPRDALGSWSIIGKSDEEVLPESNRAVIIGHKRRAITTRTTQTFEVSLPASGDEVWYRVDVVPIVDGGAPIGIVCTAIDITRSKRLDRMRRDLSRRLAETLQRFNLALRSERITVFAQDLDLRYTWANTSETQAGSILGRTDYELLPPGDLEPVVALKKRVIEGKAPASAEIGVGQRPDRRWYDLHVEPNLSTSGDVIGLTGASIDVTHRHRNEEQMRLVMRELTHRTKNLLAVVIAVARQTANSAETVDDYVPDLIARLRALSAAQDLIVADDWAGVSIADLVRVIVAPYVSLQSGRVRLDGPSVTLSPEASQNLGLALHELASNASRYGAFSKPSGTLSVDWYITDDHAGERLALTWRERGGPAVTERPCRCGFGMTVVERNLTRALSAEVDVRFEKPGLTVEILVPLRGIRPSISTDREIPARTQ